MLIGARRAVLGARPWWLASAWLSSAADRPAVIIDHNRGRYALPKLGPTLIDPASWQMSTSGTGATATNSPAGTLNLTGNGVGNTAFADYQVPTVVGETYCFTATTSSLTILLVGTTQGGSNVILLGGGQNGAGTYVFTALSSSTWIRWQRTTAGLAVVTGVEVKNIQLTTLRSATFAECLSVSATRSATASSYVGSDGLMQFLATSDIPRFTWLGGKRRLVVDPAATNLVTYSEDLDNAAWTKSNGSISANAAVAPTGAQTGDIFVENSATSTHTIAKGGFSVTSGTYYSFTFFVKAFGRSWGWCSLDSGTFGGSNTAWFDFGNGTVGTVQGSTTCTITPYGNGIYRCKYTRAATVSAGSALYIGLATGDTNTSYTGDGTSGAMIWGVQVEATAFDTSYIPTAAATVTRAAEIVTGSALLTALHRRATGTHVMRYLQQDDPVLAPARQTLWSMNMDFGNSRLSVRKAPSAGAEGPQGAVGNGSSVSSLTAGSGLGADAGESIGAVLAWDASSSRLAVKGALAGGSDGGGWDAASNSASVFYIGRNSDGTTPSAMLIDQDLIYPVRVSNTALSGLAVRAA